MAFGSPQAVFQQSAIALRQVVHSTQVAALCAEPVELAALLDLT
jgi:hypothetical protein